MDIDSLIDRSDDSHSDSMTILIERKSSFVDHSP